MNITYYLIIYEDGSKCYKKTKKQLWNLLSCGRNDTIKAIRKITKEEFEENE